MLGFFGQDEGLDAGQAIGSEAREECLGRRAELLERVPVPDIALGVGNVMLNLELVF